MHAITHLLASLLISVIVSFKYDVGPIGFLLAALSGTLVDADHLYNYVRYHGFPESLKKLIQRMSDAYKQPPDLGFRYHTAAHELVGLLIFLSVSIVIGCFYSPTYALLIFLPILGHFVLDSLSIKMMFFSPFSKKEFYIGILKPNSAQERALIAILLVATLLLIFLRMIMDFFISSVGFK